MTEPVAQMALEVDPAKTVVITEVRGPGQRELRVGPIPEPQARALVGFLLNRPSEVEDGDGPWRLAVAGGARTVHLEGR
jgi:hypothetical protein